MVWAKVRLRLPIGKSDTETDANDTSGELGLALLGSLVGKSQLRIPKFELEIMFSIMVLVVSIEIGHH